MTVNHLMQVRVLPGQQKFGVQLNRQSIVLIRQRQQDRNLPHRQLGRQVNIGLLRHPAKMFLLTQVRVRFSCLPQNADLIQDRKHLISVFRQERNLQSVLYGVRSFLVKRKTVNLEKTGRYRSYTQNIPVMKLVNMQDLKFCAQACGFDSHQGYKKRDEGLIAFPIAQSKVA